MFYFMQGGCGPARPELAEQASRFVLLERAVEQEYRPLMLAELHRRVDVVAQTAQTTGPACPLCGQIMRRKDTRPVSWLARLLALLAAVAPYSLAARLAWLLLGVEVNAMSVWRAAQRSGQAAADYSEGLSAYHAGSRSQAIVNPDAPQTVVLSVDGCALGMQVRPRRRRRRDAEKLPPLPAVPDGHFREVKTGVLLLPDERVETSPGRHSLVRWFLVSCLGDADAIFHRLYAQLRELGWMGANTTVVIVGDGAEWIWNRAKWFIRRCEILDFWHALAHAWTFARLRYGDSSAQADRWVHQIAEDLRAGKVKDVIARLKRLHPNTAELQESLAGLIHYYTENAGRMRYDEYRRLGYGIGSGAVESAHKQVIHSLAEA